MTASERYRRYQQRDKEKRGGVPFAGSILAGAVFLAIYWPFVFILRGTELTVFSVGFATGISALVLWVTWLFKDL